VAGNQVALMADYQGQPAGVDAAGREEGVAHHRAAADLMQDLGGTGFHPRTGACCQNYDGGWAGILGDHVRVLLASLRVALGAVPVLP
jgi:hypothetical protein